ncbi:MAG: response regulator [Candidatus Latescibacteria bacterium]|nr:response regulator [Candidatus Latescibacterota bacterium]
MNWISETDFIDELHHNAATQDLIKGRILMDHLPDVSEETQRKVLIELDYFDHTFAAPLLGYLLCGALEGVNLSTDEIQMVLAEKVREIPDLILNLVGDVALVNKLKLVELANLVAVGDLLPSVLAGLETTSVTDQVLPLLAMIKHMASPQTVNVLAEYLYSGDRALIIEAIDALANIGNFEAVDALAERLGSDRELDTLIFDRFSQIKTEHALEKLTGALGAPDAYGRNHAKALLTQVGRLAVPALIEKLACDDSDVLIHTLNVLGLIGNTSAIRPIRNLLHNEPPDPNVRFAAYEALGLMPVEKGAYVLAAGLTELDGMVRVAAAKAIEKNLDKTLLLGLKNLTKSEDEDTARVVAALVDGPADDVLLHLIDEPNFFNMVVKYLSDGAHPDTLVHIKLLLQRNGRSEQANRLEQFGEFDNRETGLLIYAVDDSRMILRLYKKALFELGYEVVPFEFPKTVCEKVQQNKPDLVFTDLNMPEMTGIELTSQIRKLYGVDELPVVMVTTQSEGTDLQEAKKAGISKIIHKPFDAEKLQQVIEQFTRS